MTLPAQSARLSRPGGAAATRHRRGRVPWLPWLLLAAPLLLAAIFKFYPMVLGVRMSFYKVQPLLGDIFLGLENYANVMTDQRFHDALWHTVQLGVGSSVGAAILGLLLALLLEGKARSLSWVRTAVFLPVVTAVAVVGEIWRLLYFPTEAGLINRVLGMVGIGPLEWLNSPDTALASVLVVTIWMAAPYNMVIFVAGLTGVDRELYEAAAVDGASTWRRLWSITFPSLASSFTIVFTLAAIRSLRVFTEVYVLTGGGPAASTEVWMTRVFNLGFQRYDLGLASAASTLLLLVTLALTVGVQWLSAKGAKR